MVMLTKDFAEYLFEPFQGNSGQVFFVKAFIGEVELFTKSFPVKEGLPMESEDVIGGCQDGCEVVDERSGPVKDEISDQWKRR